MQTRIHLNNAARMIASLGHLQTFILAGYMGWGKTSVGKMLQKMFPDYLYCWIDCTTRVDAGDLMMPNVQYMNENGFIEMVPLKDLMLHTGKKLIINFDEYGKNEAFIRPATSVMYERKLGTLSLPEGSIVFGTTNLASENLGDLIEAHQWNRFTTLYTDKPTGDLWRFWAFENGIHPSVIGCSREVEAWFQVHDDGAGGKMIDPNDNPYIPHPDAPERKHFVTGRSLEHASNLIHAFDANAFDEDALTSALIGTIGAPATGKLMSFIRLAGRAPKLTDVCADPTGTMVPDDPTVLCMMVDNAIGSLKGEQVNGWCKYIQRMPSEVQGMFVNMARDNERVPKSRQKIFWRSKEFVAWIAKNKHLFTADDV